MPASFDLNMTMSRPYKNRGGWKIAQPDNIWPAPNTTNPTLVQNSGLLIASTWDVACIKRSNNFRTGPWTSVALDARCERVAFSPALNRYVAVMFTGGTNTGIWRSDDAITWVVTTAPAAAYHDVKWVPELALFIAIAEFQNQYTSPDGITWTARDLTVAHNGTHRTGAWNGTRFVIVDGTGGGTAGTRAHSSPDLINWVHHVTPQDGGADPSWRHVLWCDSLGKFICCAAGDGLMDSSDGITWGNFRKLGTALGGVTISSIIGMAWSPLYKILVCRINITNPADQTHKYRFAWSRNGTTWKRAKVPITNGVSGGFFVQWLDSPFNIFASMNTTVNARNLWSRKGR